MGSSALSETKMRIETVLVTPALASKWLENNKGNRHITPNRVKLYASDMKAGRWALSPQGVIRSHEGKLLDGQHRLSAVVAADCSVLMSVIYCDAEMIKNLDGGQARTAGDLLTMSGSKNANLVASVGKTILAFNLGSVSLLNGVSPSGRSGAAKGNSSMISRREVVDFCETNAPLLAQLSEAALSVYRLASMRLMTATEIAFLLWYFGNTDQALKFLTSVFAGVGLMPGSAELAMRRILEQRHEKERVISSVDMLQYFKLAFDKSQKGEVVKLLKIVK